MATAGALVVVDKQVAGEVWSNTYGIGLGAGPYSVQPADADMIAFGAGGDFSDTATANTASPFADVLHAIVNFERRIHDDEVQFQRIYVTDGKRNFDYSTTPPGEVINSYFTASLSFNATGNVDVEGGVATGLVSLLAAKNPLGFSARRGRCFYRLCLNDSEIAAEASGLIKFASLTMQTQAFARFNTALTASGLANHFAGGSAVAGGLLLIPHFSRFVPAVGTTRAHGGEMIGGTAMVGFVPIRPVGRQVKRGRKRPALG